jgi:hypothetical protein
MTARRARPNSVGLLAGVSVFSTGLLSMFLASNPGGPVQASNPCAGNGTAAVGRPASAGGSQIHLTALVVRGAGNPGGTASPAASTASPAASTASPSPTAKASKSPSPHPSASVNPGSPMSSATPTTSSKASPSTSPKASPTSSPSPDKTPHPSPNQTGTPTPSTSPTPTPTKSSTPPPKGELCISVQSLKGSVVHPGSHARYAIFVWVTTGSANAKISLAAKPHRFSPAFTVCPATGKASCSVGVGTSHTELQARIAIPKKAAKTTLKLTATETSKDTKNASTSASATVHVQAKAKSSPSPSPDPTSPGPGIGDGGTLPPGTLPPGGLPPGALPPGAIPSASFPGLPSPTGDAGSGFPTVLPSPSPAPASLPKARSIEARDVSAGLPLNVRLIGGQLVGLTILAAAVTIAVARLSLRKQRPRRTDESS